MSEQEQDPREDERVQVALDKIACLGIEWHEYLRESRQSRGLPA